MPDEYVLTGASMNSRSSAKSTISSKRSWISRLLRPSMMPLMKTFSRPGDLWMKTGAELDERRDAADDADRSARRLGDAGHELQRRALAGSVFGR